LGWLIKGPRFHHCAIARFREKGVTRKKIVESKEPPSDEEEKKEKRPQPLGERKYSFSHSPASQKVDDKDWGCITTGFLLHW